ncbi:hypothetical protein GTO10_01405 [Candidatus Saccharibacteria bacterium]|nr:hypothetical protein [Candidatus Saccharibacteria bacterium]
MKLKVLALTTLFAFTAAATPVAADVTLDAGLSVNKTQVERGDTLNYTFKVVNTTDIVIDPVFVAPGMNGDHVFSPYVDYVTGSTVATKGASTVNVTDAWLTDGLNLGKLNPGQEVSVAFKAVVREDAPDNAFIESVVQIKKTWLEDPEANEWIQCAAVSTLKGEVLGEVLPETGTEDVIATSLLLGYFGILLRKLKLTRYL